ncbi:penicillin-binding transpeptidase domain-containing protein [Granulicoccus phenolivorans]|uniref:penicillin-binding transpeptidase domain-containing protein n=1 Tax=Granulicoccus phenolivorans TaxID=266854 RepID=UPI000416E0D1|nr:penicillin-binding transpeptidase domain-containing protein [Granulicoccus phenolivorans]
MLSPQRVLTASAAITVALVLAGCTKGGTLPGLSGPDPAEDVTRLTQALSNTDLSQIPASADAQADLTEILKGMDGIKPTVTSTNVSRSGDAASVGLKFVWPFPSGPWEYTTAATLQFQNDKWTLQWNPNVIHPQLTEQTRMVHQNTQATRGRILGKFGTPIAQEEAILRYGINKAKVDAATAESSAGALADALKINRDNYVTKVKSAGAQAFVEAITLRIQADQPDVSKIPGAETIRGARTLPIDGTFAPELIGTVGTATDKQVADSKGALLPGDQTGMNGLQSRYDELFRGTPAVKVTLVPRTTPTPAPGATATPATTQPITVLDVGATTGGDIATTLDIDLQRKAEKVIGGVSGAASIAVIQPSTGKLVAAANSDGSAGNPDATFGRYAPGSTYKVVTALALLRTGMTPDSQVNCSPTATVDGRQFKNYSDFPSNRNGTMTLSAALETSCNTAFINEVGKLSVEQLREAAASLGLGQDYDAGFASFFGNLPEAATKTELAASLIGQGQVEANAMAMAAVPASVQARKTVVPYLIDQKFPPQPSKPLTQAEGDQLAQMMEATVSRGTGSSLQGVAKGAKTGTAEYGNDTPLKTHAWMIAYADDIAVAVWVKDGQSGGSTAGPIIKQFLQQ